MTSLKRTLALALSCACSVAGGMAWAQTGGDIPAALLPRDLSPWGMFESAHVVVKAVMIGLAFASVVTWTIGLAKFIEIVVAKRKLEMQSRAVASSADLATALARLQGRGMLETVASVAQGEIQLSAAAVDKSAVRERVLQEIERVVAGEGLARVRGMGVLATIGATAPFVGLFGTVWGIMNSFIGISQQHTTNLAVVAPGIAEALLATALGLVAAIPAVVIYNFLSRQIGGYRAAFLNSSMGVATLASRALDIPSDAPARRSRAAE